MKESGTLLNTLVLLPKAERFSLETPETLFRCQMYDGHMVPYWCTIVKMWYHMDTKARTVRFTEQDNEAIAALKAYYGLTRDNEVIRLALRVARREIQGKEPPLQV